MSGQRIIVQVDSPRRLAQAKRAGLTELLVSPPLAPAANGARPFVLEGGVVRRDGRPVGRVVDVRSPEDERRLRRLRGTTGWLFLRTHDWRVIPLENLVAAFQGRPKIAVFARSAEDARLLLETLERGVEACVVSPRTSAEFQEYQRLASGEPAPAALEAWRIARVEDVPAADRVCVDTAHLLRPDEGLLVGSTARALFLVASEARHGRYVEARPFRVNAGAVHSYVFDGAKTHYLSELKAGSRVVAVDAKGRTRRLTVGRVKVETRPLRLVHARGPGGSGSLLIQNAETVRLVGARGRTIPATSLRAGDRVLVHAGEAARHAGMAVKERIVER